MTNRMFSNGFVLAATALALALPLPASAVVLVGGQGPAVTVDTSVFDGSRRLDLPSGSGGLLMPGERTAPGDRVHLVPPGQKSLQGLTLVPPSGKAQPLLLTGSQPVVLTPPKQIRKKAPSSATEVDTQVQLKAADAPVLTPPPAPAPETPWVAALAPSAIPIPIPPIPGVPAAPTQPQATTPAASIALVFEPEEPRLNETHRALLKDVITRLSQAPEANVQLLAYAQSDNRNKARRLSLARALAVRSYLLSQDVRNTRIEVRALGDQLPVSGGKPDRVDVVIEKP